MRIVSLGEILWDVFPDGEHLGGAPFNFSAHARRLGADVVLLSAVGEDARGRAAIERASELGLPAGSIQQTDQAPTGIVQVELDSQGQPSYVIVRPAAYDFVRLNDAQLAALVSPPPDWIYFGTLHLMDADVRKLARRLLDAAPAARTFYDVNLRPQSYSTDVLRELLGWANVLKLNEDEVREISRLVLGSAEADLESFCRDGAQAFGWETVCITRGSEGCLLWTPGETVSVEGYPADVADAVGAGDAFSAALVHELGSGSPLREAGDFANRVGALVASRRGAVPAWRPQDLQPSRL